MADKIEGYLEVGRNEAGKVVEVSLVDRADLKPDENGVGPTLVSADQARNLTSLMKHAAKAAAHLGAELLPVPSGPYMLRCVLAAKLLDKTRPYGLREGTVGRVEASPFELQQTGEWRIMFNCRGVNYCLPVESLQLTETDIPSPCIKEHKWK